MTKCKGTTTAGKKCRANAGQNGYCYWHQPEEECAVCTEELDKPLPCGHWVHKDCVQKAADSMQEIRAQSGHPPLKYCQCPICRMEVPGMIPKDPPPSTHDIYLYSEEIQALLFIWILDMSIPLYWYIWTILCEKYPEYNRTHLMGISLAFQELIAENVETENPIEVA